MSHGFSESGRRFLPAYNEVPGRRRHAIPGGSPTRQSSRLGPRSSLCSSADPVKSTGTARSTPLERGVRVKPTLRQTYSRPEPRVQFAFKDSMIHIICNSHYVSHFAAFFIDTGAKISVVESCLWLETAVRQPSTSSGGFWLGSIGVLPTGLGPLPVRGERPPRPARPAGVAAGTSAQPADFSRRKSSRPRGYVGSRCVFDRCNDPSAGSPTETLLRLLLPLGGRV